MKRRSVLAMFGGAAMAVTLGARAQKTVIPVVGFLCSETPAQWARLVEAFRQGLSETGYVEGKNVQIEFRWAEGEDDRLPALAVDLVRRRVAVLVTTGGPRPALAAKAATSTVPIVFTLGADPVKLGVVAALGRPGANITGVTFISGQLNAKRIEQLHEVVPHARLIALLVNPDNPNSEPVTSQAQEAARSLGKQTHILRAHSEQEIDAAFAALVQLRAGALFVASDAYFYGRREQFGALIRRYAMPTSFELREYVAAGGLMSYGASLSEVYRQAGVYVGRILDGAKPADLPVLLPTKVELVINLKTAKALGLAIPQSLLVRADEVIQ